MFCPKCGSKISDGAKFCTECGLPLGSLAPEGAVEKAEQNGAKQEPAEVLASAAEEASSEEPSAFKTTAEDARPDGAEASASAESVATDSEQAGFQAETASESAAQSSGVERSRMYNFFLQKRQIGGRLVPQFAVMIAAFIAAAGIAYAAFMLYKNVIEPNMQQSAQQEQVVKKSKKKAKKTEKKEEKAEEPAQEQPAQEQIPVDTTAQTNEAAHTAYQDVLTQYREALTNGDYDDYGSGGGSLGETNGNGYFTDGSSNTKYPLVNDMVGNASGMYASGVTAATSQYAFVDLNGDGIDELLFNDPNSVHVYAVYGYIDGQVKGLLQGWERNTYTLCQNGLLRQFSSGGYATNTYQMLKYESGPTFTEVDKVAEDVDGSNITTVRTQNGQVIAQATDPASGSQDNSMALFDQFKADYPEDTSVAWQPMVQ